MANRSKNPRRAASSVGRRGTKPDAGAEARGRLDHGPTVAVIDIGSNSVRLVAYEGLTRSPAPVFNEKILCGLGSAVQSTGLLADDAVVKALKALRRFRALCDVMQVAQLWVVATAACRDAENGPAFIKEAEKICGQAVEVLSGKEEAEFSALGVIAGFYKPDGLVADLGGGSLELVEVRGHRVGRGKTFPLGGLALQDASGKSVKKAEKIVKSSLARHSLLRQSHGRTLYAVGGTWRALARLHMWQRGYPMHVTHGYAIPAQEMAEFLRHVRRVNAEGLSQIGVVSDARRPLLAYGAVVLEHLVRLAKPRQVVISALGVREGLLYGQLPVRTQKLDPLITAAHELNVLRSRSPQHGEDLMVWTDRFMATAGLDESQEEQRLRHTACLLSDIGWRAHPDYRGEQSFNIIAHAGFIGIDHPGRAYIALAIFFRHVGLVEDDLSPRLRELASARILDRARVLGAAMRVAFIVSAAMPDVLTRTPLLVKRGKLILDIRAFPALNGDRLFSRLRQLARLIGREPVMLV